MLIAEEHARRKNLYDQGLYDHEIANELFLHKGTIYDWRVKRGLAAHGGSGHGGRRSNTKYQPREVLNV
jgi:transposase